MSSKRPFSSRDGNISTIVFQARKHSNTWQFSTSDLEAATADIKNHLQILHHPNLFPEFIRENENVDNWTSVFLHRKVFERVCANHGRDKAIEAIVRQIRSHKIDFPFKRICITTEEAREMFERIRSWSTPSNSEARWSHEYYQIRDQKSSSVQYPTDFALPIYSDSDRLPSGFQQPMPYVDTQTKGNYWTMDILADYFIEPSRVLAFRSRTKISPYDAWLTRDDYVRQAVGFALPTKINSGGSSGGVTTSRFGVRSFAKPSSLPEPVVAEIEKWDPDFKKENLNAHSLREALYSIPDVEECPHEKTSFLARLLHLLLPRPNESNIFDACGGYGDRLLASMAIGAKSFVGIEPNNDSIAGFREMINMFAPNDNYHMLCTGMPNPILPDNLPDSIATNNIDLCFISPPSYNSEDYGKHINQSVIQFPDRDDWVLRFLYRTLRKIWEMLRPGGILIIQSILISEINPYIHACLPDSCYLGAVSVAVGSTNKPRNKPMWIWLKTTPASDLVHPQHRKMPSKADALRSLNPRIVARIKRGEDMPDYVEDSAEDSPEDSPKDSPKADDASSQKYPSISDESIKTMDLTELLKSTIKPETDQLRISRRDVNRLEKKYRFDNICNAIGELIAEGVIGFPYKRTTMCDPKILMENLRQFETRSRQDGFVLKGITFKTKFFFSYTYTDDDEATGDFLTFLSCNDDYERMDIITDYFQEHARMSGNLHNMKSPLEIWADERERTKVIKRAMSLAMSPSDSNSFVKVDGLDSVAMREAIYGVTKECTLFKVSFALSILRKFCAKRVLDFSAGWGDRLISTIAHGVEQYTGFDPNIALKKGHDEIILTLASESTRDRFKIIYEPFQSRAVGDYLVDNAPKEGYDLIFTSPPFFDLEIYDKGSGSGQSVDDFPRYDDWAVRFLLRSITRAWKYLSVNGHLAIYISDIGRESTGCCELMCLYIGARLKGARYSGVIASRNEDTWDKPRPVWVWVRDEKEDQLYRDKCEELGKKHYPALWEKMDKYLSVRTDAKDSSQNRTI